MKRATQGAETNQVGRSVPRLESWLKVTGRAEYVHNLRLPGMLYGKIFRSSVAHGRIKSIDTSAATDRPTRIASAEAAAGLKIEGDLHGSAAYKKQLVRVYVKRAIDEARNAGR